MPQTIEGFQINHVRETAPDEGAAEASAPDDYQVAALTQERTDSARLSGLDPHTEADHQALRRAPQDSNAADDAPEKSPQQPDVRQQAVRQAGTHAVAGAPLEIHAVGAPPRMPEQSGPMDELGSVELPAPAEAGKADTHEVGRDASAGPVLAEATDSVNDPRTIAGVGDGQSGHVGLPTMESERLTTYRTWAEALEHRADDPVARQQDRTRAQLEYRTSGADRFLENMRDPKLQAMQDRRATLEGLDHQGFSRNEINELRGIIASSGLPIRGLTSFVHESDRESVDANGHKGGQVIASMHTHGEHRGRFTVHDVYYQASDEEKKATTVHEMTHNLSALRPENRDIFGEGEDGERERQAIASYVAKVAEQSLVTGVHLNGYHKHLMQEYSTREAKLQEAVRAGNLTEREAQQQIAIAKYKYTEETQAILTEMSFFKRAKLEQVQEAQAKRYEDMARIAGIDPHSELLPESVRGRGLPERVQLITNQDAEPGAPGVGADRIAITLLRGVGVTNHDELLSHIDNFKGRQWGSRSPRVQRERALQAA